MVGCSPFSVGSIRNKHHPNVAEYTSDYGSEMYIYFLFNPGDNSMNRCQIQLDFHSESVAFMSVRSMLSFRFRPRNRFFISVIRFLFQLGRIISVFEVVYPVLDFFRFQRNFNFHRFMAHY